MLQEIHAVSYRFYMLHRVDSENFTVDESLLDERNWEGSVHQPNVSLMSREFD